jgi:RNA polymerase sigma factor (sigma-70 family)
VAQNTWLKLVTHIDRIENPDAVGSWLAVTATRECLALHQRQRREVPSPETVLEIQVFLDTDALIEQLDAARIGGALRRAIALLQPRERAVVVGLLGRHELSYAELSSRLGMPVGAIGPVRGRALRKLRGWLAQRDDDVELGTTA